MNMQVNVEVETETFVQEAEKIQNNVTSKGE
jgi:hypothetical protein